jgi:hypothetical protein
LLIAQAIEGPMHEEWKIRVHVHVDLSFLMCREIKTKKDETLIRRVRDFSTNRFFSSINDLILCKQTKHA